MIGLASQSLALLVRLVGPVVVLVALLQAPVALLQSYAEYAKWFGEQSQFAFGVLAIFSVPLCNGAIIALAAARAEQRPLSLGQALLKAVHAWRRLVVAYLILSLILVAWSALFVGLGVGILMLAGVKEMYWLGLAVPFIAFMMTPYVFLDTVIMVEGAEPYPARRRSVSLAQGHRWFLFGAMLLLMTPPLALELGGSMFAGIIAQQIGGTPWVIATALAIASSLLYAVELIVFYVIYRRLVAPGEGA